MNIATNLPDPIDDTAFRFKIPDLKDVISGELAESGDWIVANISTNSFWPINSQKVRWRDVDIWIMPIMKGCYPALAMKLPQGRGRDECEELVLRFLWRRRLRDGDVAECPSPEPDPSASPAQSATPTDNAPAEPGARRGQDHGHPGAGRLHRDPQCGAARVRHPVAARATSTSSCTRPRW